VKIFLKSKLKISTFGFKISKNKITRVFLYTLVLQKNQKKSFFFSKNGAQFPTARYGTWAPFLEIFQKNLLFFDYFEIPV